MDPETFELLLLKLILQDKQYLITVASVFSKEYFNNRTIGEVVECAKYHYEKYREVPPIQAIKSFVTSENDLEETIAESNAIDFDFAKNYDFFLDESNKYLKNQSIKQAIIKSVDIINNAGNINEIREIVEVALCKDIRIDLGTDYFGGLGERLRRILSCAENRMPTYYPMLDEVIGGFPPYTLSVFGGAVHGFKSQFLVNLACRQALHGKNIVIITLEMSEDAFCQRIDSTLSLKDINRIYTVREITAEMIRKLKHIKEDTNTGSIFVKQFPTGSASIQDYRIYLRELMMRNIQIDMIYVDYLQLMKPSQKILDGTMYSRGKKIAEELRALSFEFATPVITLSQLKPAAGREELNDMDLYMLQESSAISATADCIVLLGKDEERMVYENQIGYKIVKNRLGGQVGTTGILYYDARSLKIYDETEISIWLNDVKESKDVRELHERRA
ncbi:hypothetical protein M0R04_16345 [Candidatus Dojkabacteria bacterium]|jgi:hypothetical protein|nr:hypothetical protein [Candidatus Dojkabacteria bacterium]